MGNKKIKARGLRALIPVKARAKSKRKKISVFYIEIKKIRQTPEMLKKQIDKKTLKELTGSIREYGVLQPLIVAKVEKRKKGGGLNVYYRLVAGQRRLLAAREAGLRVVPAVINPPSLKLRRTKRNDKV